MLGAVRDLVRSLVPVRNHKKKYGYAFLVHPRNRFDVTRKFPLLRFLPKKLIDMFTKFLWPIVISEIKELKHTETGESIPGWIISVPLTAEQMTKNRGLALKRILQAGKLAQNMGVKIIGLGALTSSFSRGGLDLVEHLNIGVTTGHAYTSYIITNYIDSVSEKLSLPREKLKIAVVGAAGSIGSTCGKILAKNGYRDFLLIEQNKKIAGVKNLEQEIKKINYLARIEISSEINRCRECHFIMTATNAPEVIIKNEHVSPGTVIFDDAQPSDIDREVLHRPDVVVLEAGVVSIPIIKNNFNMGLKQEQDNFSCLGEVVILASEKWDKHYVLNRATIEMVDEIGGKGNRLGIGISELQNRKDLIDEKKIENVKEIIKNRIENV